MDAEPVRRRLNATEPDDEFDYTDVEYPVIKEHHSLLAMYDHFNYCIGTAKGVHRRFVLYFDVYNVCPSAGER